MNLCRQCRRAIAVLLTSLLLTTILLIDPTFDNRNLARAGAIKSVWRTMLMRFAVCAGLLTFLTIVITANPVSAATANIRIL